MYLSTAASAAGAVGRELHPAERAAGQSEQKRVRAPEAARLRRVVAALPLRVAADEVHRHLPPHAVAPRDRRGEARERQERVHEVRIRLAPHPRVHPAHRRADHEPQMGHAETLGQEPVLRADHVVVRVARELRPEPVARLRRAAVPDPVGDHHVIARGVERLARAEQNAGERRAEELRRRAARPVQDEHRVRGFPAAVVEAAAVRDVVNLQLRERLAGREPEVSENGLIRDGLGGKDLSTRRGGRRDEPREHRICGEPANPPIHRLD